MIFLTGTTGFIGSHILNCLLTHENIENIAVLHRQPLEQSKLRGFPNQNLKQLLKMYPSVRSILGTLNDTNILDMETSNVTTVIHAASKNIDHDGTGFDENVVGTECLCKAAVRNGVNKLIYISSVGVYGHTQHSGNDETLPPKPDSALSRSKAKCERVILKYHNQGYFQAIILRPRFVYGTGDFHVMPRLIKAVGKTPFLINQGQAQMSFIWVEDLAKIITKFALNSIPQQNIPIYHANDGQPMSLREISLLVSESFGYPFPKYNLPLWLLYPSIRLFEIMFGIDSEASRHSVSSTRLKFIANDNYFSNEKLRKQFPDFTFVPFAEGFKRSLCFYKTVVF
ncbi:MAG: NAD-dependent epimerase/dehydratase family protein [Hydrococcus sp. SU_1_0]|nr:NAD-dependent epimerase/dehydratase family protein [Hydrococcus sp. SU_1_0]NJO98743.1 NAD-dependent epimerase/dehydratase family protein [Pleurocapsa sp. CRU_1_2]